MNSAIVILLSCPYLKKPRITPPATTDAIWPDTFAPTASISRWFSLSYDLVFNDRITLVGGDSGTGKTVLYDILEDLKQTEEYNAIKLFNYKSEDVLEKLKQCRNNFVVIDNADILMDDEVRRFINFEFSNQYMLFLRNCDGLNVSDKSFKVMKVESNMITLEEEL